MLDLNIAPYRDDFDAEKNFHKILFRPGYPVQSRELTQIQSILQNQIKSFGDHIFKNGSMVIPGNVRHDLGVKAVRITVTPGIVASDWVNKRLFGVESEVTVHVIKTEQTGNDVVAYVKTVANGITNNALDLLADDEPVEFLDDGGAVPVGSTILSGAVTDASLGFVNEGIYYVNGYFVRVDAQSVILSSTSKTPSCKVGLVLSEEIISESDDSSLLDPALGSSNENAPGAHRQKLSLVLTKYNTGEETDPSFILLFQLDAGELIRLVSFSTYSELMKTMARRTYEESGNYTVVPYDIQLKEQNPVAAALDLFVTKGSAYVGGYEIDNQFNRMTAEIDKARETKLINNALLRTKIGNYFFAADTYGLPRSWSYIELHDNSLPLLSTGTATAGATTSITDTGKAWIPNEFVGMKVFVTSGTGAGQAATITSNTATVLTIDTVSVAFAASSVYEIRPTAKLLLNGTSSSGSTTTLVVAGTPWTVNQFAGKMLFVKTAGGAGYYARITSNTNNSLTFPAIAAAVTTSVFEIRDPSTIIGFAKVRAVEKTAMSGIYKVFVFDVEFAKNKSLSDVVAYREVNSGTRATGNVLNTYSMANATGTFTNWNATQQQEITCGAATTRRVRSVYYDTTKRVIYAKKAPGDYQWVKQGDLITQATSNAAGSVSAAAAVQEPSASVPILKLPKSAIKATSDHIYYVTRQQQVTLNGSGVGAISLLAGETLKDVSNIVVWVPATGAFVSSSAWTATEGGTSISFTSGPASATVIASFGVRRTSTSFPQKAKVENQVIKNVTAGQAKSRISLDQNSAFEIVSVMEGAVNITNMWRLVTNERDGIVGSSYIELVSGGVVPSGALAITYKYYTVGAGDFSSVESYPPANYVSIPTYVDSFGNTLDLRDCLDFRPTSRPRSFSVTANTTASNTTITLATSNGTFAAGDTIYGPGLGYTTTVSSLSGTGQLVLSVAPTETLTDALFITGFDTASNFTGVEPGETEAVMSVSDWNLDYEYYLPRIDTVCITNSGTLEVFEGTPADDPKPPYVVESDLRMKLADLTIPAYTFDPKEVVIGRYNRRGYTMKDIAGIDSRLSNVEEVTALNMLEQELASTQIIDAATGLNRFKSGFAVDNFTDHVVMDLENEETLAMMDYSERVLLPLDDEEALNLILVTGESTNYLNQNNLVMLPYTEIALVDQPMATRPQNINPFAVFKWFGTITLSPGSDFWTDTQRLADINISQTIVN